MAGAGFQDEVGKRYARLTVLRRTTSRTGRGSAAWWECLCDCGELTKVTGSNLRSGNTKSCGCWAQDFPSHTIHGMNGSRAHVVWTGMRQRCTDPKASSFKWYGGRGIRVCDRWASFKAFYEDMGDPPFEGASIDRIDVNGNYEPSNCRWATATEQARNTRANLVLTFLGKSQCAEAWANEVGIPGGTLRLRLRNGWPTERALTEPVHTKKRNKLYALATS